MGNSVMGWAAMSWYSVGPCITLLGRITAKEYVEMLVNEAGPLIQTLFPNNYAVFHYTQLELFSHGLKSIIIIIMHFLLLIFCYYYVNSHFLL
jgi:hypothetical protein